jgi:hypothetical protein
VRAFDSFWPNCNFEVGRLDQENSQIIEPDRFTVRRSQFLTEEVVQRAEAVHLASLRLADGQDSGGHSMIYEGWHLWLESPDQPDVRRLTCRGVFADPHRADPPSIAEIRDALGDIATLLLPGSPSPEDVVPGPP